jgi:hypothetical protein
MPATGMSFPPGTENQAPFGLEHLRAITARQAAP